MFFMYPSGLSSSLVSTTVLVILVVVFLIIGVLVGLTVGVLVVYGCLKWKLSHHHLPPSTPQPPPDPIYEDIDMIETELNKNVAYGIVKYPDT